MLSFDNMRSSPFKAMAHELSATTKFFLGKNKVMIRALGTTPESEYADNTHKLSKYLTGQCCLAFSSMKPSDFKLAMLKFEVEDFA